MKDFGCEKFFHGKHSGVSVKNDKKLIEMTDFIREDDDEVVVCRLDRLGRSLKSILDTIDNIHKKKATLNIIDGSLNISNDNPFSTEVCLMTVILMNFEKTALTYLRIPEAFAITLESTN